MQAGSISRRLRPVVMSLSLLAAAAASLQASDPIGTGFVRARRSAPFRPGE